MIRSKKLKNNLSSALTLLILLPVLYSNAVSADSPVPISANIVGYVPTGAGAGAGAETVQRKLSEVVSVKDFGAVGDGVADDTNAIAAAINYALTLKKATVLLEGNFVVSRPLSFTFLPADGSVGRSLTIKGKGAITSIVNETGLAAYTSILSFVGNADFSSMITIEDITIQGTSTTWGFLNGLAVSKFASVDLVRPTTTAFSGKGIYVDNCKSGTIIAGHSTFNKTTGLEISQSSSINVIGGTYSFNGFDKGIGGYGVAFGSASTANSNSVVDGVTAIGNVRKGIDIHNGTNMRVVNNYVELTSHTTGGAAAGIYAVNESTSKIVSNVLIEGNQVVVNSCPVFSYGIDIGSSSEQATTNDGFTVIGNFVKTVGTVNSSYKPLYVRNPSNANSIGRVIVSDNAFNGTSSAGAAIEIANSPVGVIDKLTITANTINADTSGPVIYIRSAKVSNVSGNIITVPTATAHSAVYVTTEVVPAPSISIVGNKLLGNFTNSYLPTNPTTYISGNTQNGLILPDAQITPAFTDPSLSPSGKYFKRAVTGGTTGTVNLVTTNLASPNDSLTFHVIVLASGYANTGKAVFEGYATCYGKGSFYTPAAMTVKSTLIAGQTIPALSWVNTSGGVGTLQLSLPTTTTGYSVEIESSGYTGTFNFVP